MVSIITAIYNQLDMNRLYYRSICENTDGDWELIIIDNGSTDGSREFFQTLGDSRVHVIANKENFSYPHCQNQGIAVARGNILAFLNNDIFLSPHWDSHVREVIGKDGYEVVSLVSNDYMPTAEATRYFSRKFKRIKYPLLALFGSKGWVLRLITRLTYGNWNKFCQSIWEKNGLRMMRGFTGAAVIMTPKAIEVFGGWDPSQQGADFNKYMETSRRWEEVGDIRPMSMISGVFIHHFRRLSMREKYPPFADRDNLKPLTANYTQEEIDRYLSLRENFK